MIDGCSPFKIYWAIILPLSLPAIATTAIFTFIWTWDDFFGPLVYLNDVKDYTVPLALRMFRQPGQRHPIRPDVRHVGALAAADLPFLHRLPAPHHPRHRHERAQIVTNSKEPAWRR